MSTEREARWQELTFLLDRIDRGSITSLAAREVKRLASLYRQVAIDLSQARARDDDPARIHYLNALAARAHGRVYSTPKIDLESLLWFLLTGFAQVLRRRWKVVAVAAAVFLVSTAASTVAVIHNPEIAYSLFIEELIEQENVRLDKHQGEYKGNFAIINAERSHVFAAYIIANNCTVAIRMFAKGALLCMPGLMDLDFTGRMLGTLSGVLYNGGYFWDFYGLIMAHGVLELSAIVIAGAAGVNCGWALISPGQLPRGEALKAAGRDSAGMMGGVIVMLFMAGLIEAYVTPHFPVTVRVSVAAATAVLFGLYVLFAGRRWVRTGKEPDAMSAEM